MFELSLRIILPPPPPPPPMRMRRMRRRISIVTFYCCTCCFYSFSSSLCSPSSAHCTAHWHSASNAPSARLPPAAVAVAKPFPRHQRAHLFSHLCSRHQQQQHGSQVVGELCSELRMAAVVAEERGRRRGRCCKTVGGRGRRRRRRRNRRWGWRLVRKNGQDD